jgi:putative ABC transport system permease protein
MVRLSLSSLWQQKVRTALTLAGIAIGTFALAVSLSLGRGFHEEVDRQLRHGDQLRQVWVYPNTRVVEQDIPARQLEVPGDMGADKRDRLRKAILRRWPRGRKTKPPVLLTDENVARLRRLPHVESVTPMVVEVCDIYLTRDRPLPEEGAELVGLPAAPQGPGFLLALPALLPRSRSVSTFVARLSDDDLRERIVAGSYLSSPDANEVLVGEYLLYQLGIVNDAQVEQIIGQKLNVVFPSTRRTSSGMENIFAVVDQAFTPAESRAVRKVLTQLREAGLQSTLTGRESELVRKALERGLDNAAPVVPGKDAEERAALEKALKELQAIHAALKLTDADQRALERVLRRYLGEPRQSSPGHPPFDEDLVIVGVLREYLDEDENLGMQFAARTRNIDIFLPPATAERLYRHGSQWREGGFEGVFVTVDEEDNMKSVVADIKKLGLRDYSLTDFVEKVRASMTLSTFLTSFLAGVAVLVASLGITNTMFMSVLERTREIGVMKAVGARDRHIQMIFLVEGALLGVLGGSLGVFGCWLVSFPGDAYARRMLEQYSVLNHMRHSLFVFPWWLVLGVPFFAGLVTTLAAVLPARRAAKVNPITALRHE